MDNLSKIEELKETTKKLITEGNYEKAETVFSDYLELLVFRLLVDDTFFGVFTIHLQRDIDFQFRAPAGVTIIQGTIHLKVNPALLVMYTTDEITAILIHEIYHLMNLHIQRAKMTQNKFDADMENIAMDCAINQYITGLPKGCVTIDYIERQFGLSDLKKEEQYEYYLNAILNSNNYQKAKQKIQESISNFNNKIKDMLDRIKNGEEISKEELEELFSFSPDDCYANHGSWTQSGGVDIENMKELVKNIANQAYKQAGNKTPKAIEKLIGEMNKPPVINWQSEFRKMVGSVKVPYKKTPLRRDKRQPERYDIKGRISDRKIKIAVAIDTSGSMGEEELKFIFSEIFTIIQTVKFDLTVIECDMEIGRVYTAKNTSDIKYEVTGRGGTMFQPVFEYVKNDLKNNIDLLIYFTDGFGESLINEAFKPRNYQLMWVLTHHVEDLSVKNKWTDKIKELNMKH